MHHCKWKDAFGSEHLEAKFIIEINVQNIC